ncbi:hypothetical protein CF15_02015 [Pyrodictium occultum]|uniref:Uncharacterized protein n=1 Tax=Pyrodictium occultum TaxID=2309 RepID=A0A0V8RU87_PYROC|nr:hypothetical protein [Pyrodictium occultum]KSW11628.1 hypothetical protein CF15_02015 [Pyrodictium occultum]
MADPGERRRALLETLRELLRLGGRAAKTVEEIRSEIIGAVEDALGVELTPEKRMLRRLYSFNPPPQPGLEELRRLVARSMGLDDASQLEEYLRGLGRGGEAGGGSPEPHSEGGKRNTSPIAGADGEAGRGEDRQLHGDRRVHGRSSTDRRG